MIGNSTKIRITSRHPAFNRVGHLFVSGSDVCTGILSSARAALPTKLAGRSLWSFAFSAQCMRRLIAIALFASRPEILHATDFYWNNASGGQFTESANWSLLNGTPANGPGGINDTVHFNLGDVPESQYSVHGVSGESLRLVVHDDSLELQISDYYVQNLVVGFASGDTSDVILNGNGSSTLRGGYMIIGDAAGSTGNLTVVDLQWVNFFIGSIFVVGNGGSGTLNITGSSRVTASSSGATYIGDDANSTGTVNVDGAGAKFTTNRLIVGNSGTGVLNITAGGVVTTSSGISDPTVTIGNNAGSTGTVTVGGMGSTWNATSLDLRGNGTATLNIANGGLVDVSGDTTLPSGSGQRRINFDNGTLASKNLLMSNFSSLTGTGTINAGGVITDSDLVFDQSHSPQQIIINSQPNQNVTLNLNGTGDLGVGYNGQGTLSIADGVTITSVNGHLGYLAGSNGSATVTGVNSLWANSGHLNVGNDGAGTLYVTAGGKVSSFWGFVGRNFGSTGTVTVGGIGSQWNTTLLTVGNGGSGTLNIVNGGIVTSSSGLAIGSTGSGTVTVDGMGSQLNTFSLGFGGSGSATLNIVNGGLVDVSGSITVRSDTALRHISFDNGTLATKTLLLSNSSLLRGTGTIEAKGLVTNGDLVFDQSHGPQQQFLINSQPNQNITINLDMNGTGDLGAGYDGQGTLLIAEGVTVASANGYVGYLAGSNGSASVTGTGSMWNTSKLVVGGAGMGMLSITNGGVVSVGASANFYPTAIIGSTTGSASNVTVSGMGSQLNTSSLIVGVQGSSGTLNILNGGIVNSGVGGGFGSLALTTIGEFTGSGTVTVDGIGSQLNASSLEFGSSGFTTLNIANGGLVDVSGSTTLRSGSGQRRINFGNGTLATRTLLLSSFSSFTGTGTIDAKGLITNGDLVFDQSHGPQQQIIINNQPNQNITFNLDVNGTGALGAGYNSQGTLSIAEGVTIISTSGHLGYLAGSNGSATVTGANSTWANSGDLYVGNSGTGTLNITAGGKVSSQTGLVGNNSGSAGTVTVDGMGSQLNSSTLFVGRIGSGTLLVTDGGLVTSTQGNVGAFSSSGNSGTVIVEGQDSRWSITSATGHLGIGGYANDFNGTGTGAVIIRQGGEVSVERNTTIFPRGLLKLEGGTFSTSTFNGGYLFQWTSGTLHAGVFRGNLSNPGGTLAPGRSAGSTSVVGNYTQGAAATLEIEVGGVAPGISHDQLSVTGSAVLEGQLRLALLGGFVPDASSTFTILSSAALTGGFSNIVNGGRLATIDGLGSFQVHYGAGSIFNASQVVLSAFEITGDYNKNGVVDAADYVIWRKGMGTIYGENDYNLWRAHFGVSLGAGSGSALSSAEPSSGAVPEPASALPLLVAAILIWFHARGNCRRTANFD
jgi:T5SS/PEP-CTERM-associated repeat protein